MKYLNLISAAFIFMALGGVPRAEALEDSGARIANSGMSMGIVNRIPKTFAGYTIKNDGSKTYQLTIVIANQLRMVLLEVQKDGTPMICNYLKTVKNAPLSIYIDTKCNGEDLALQVKDSDGKIISTSQLDNVTANPVINEFFDITVAAEEFLRNRPDINDFQFLPNLSLWQDNKRLMSEIGDLYNDRSGNIDFLVQTSGGTYAHFRATLKSSGYTQCAVITKFGDDAPTYHVGDDCIGQFPFQGASPKNLPRRRDSGNGASAHINKVLRELLAFAKVYDKYMRP